MLPLSLLSSSIGHPILVELKSNETYNGHLVSCDGFMNLKIREGICTSADGTKFTRIAECYIKGNMIKYMRVPDEIAEMVKEPRRDANSIRGGLQRGRGGRGRGGDRGRGRGGDRRGAKA